jgi:hypothetical protein
MHSLVGEQNDGRLVKGELYDRGVTGMDDSDPTNPALRVHSLPLLSFEIASALPAAKPKSLSDRLTIGIQIGGAGARRGGRIED